MPELYTAEDWEIFKEDVKKYQPQYYHTLEWDEHPEDYDDTCFCATCRDYMAQEG